MHLIVVNMILANTQLKKERKQVYRMIFILHIKISVFHSCTLSLTPTPTHMNVRIDRRGIPACI